MPVVPSRAFSQGKRRWVFGFPSVGLTITRPGRRGLAHHARSLGRLSPKFTADRLGGGVPRTHSLLAAQ
jgi:hypothetical protein